MKVERIRALSFLTFILISSCTSGRGLPGAWYGEDPLLMPVSQPMIITSNHLDGSPPDSLRDTFKYELIPASENDQWAICSKLEALFDTASNISIEVIPRLEWLSTAEIVTDTLGYIAMYHYAKLAGARTILSIGLATFSDEPRGYSDMLICEVRVIDVASQSTMRGLTMFDTVDGKIPGVTKLAERIVQNWPLATLNWSLAQ